MNIASTTGLPHRRTAAVIVPAYDLAKAGLIRLTTTLAGLAESDGIFVNCLAPGWIATEGPKRYWGSLTPEQRLERGVPSTLLSIAQVADIVVLIPIPGS